MSKLYELTEDYLAVMDMLQDDTIDIESIMDTLEGIEGEIEQKADNYAKIIRMLKGEIVVLKAEEERINSKRKTVENNVKRLEKSLERSMIAIDKKKFRTSLFSFSIQKNLPTVTVVGEPDDIPRKFYIPQEPVLDKRALLSYIKEHGDTDYAKLTQSESLRIR